MKIETLTAQTVGGESNTLTYEDLLKMVEEINKIKIRFTPSPMIPQGTFIEIDFEKLRKEYPWIRERGKQIIHHPDDSAILEKAGGENNV